MKIDYTRAVRDEADRNLETIQDFCVQVKKPGNDPKELVDYAARLIYRQFHIRELAIGLKSPSDGRFRYVTMQGMRANVWGQHQGLSYIEEAFFDNSTYKGTMISKYTKLLLAEDNPYDEGEEGTYNEHLMRASSRKSPYDSIEGDYLDIHIFGPNNELLGWIEVSGTWDDKLPSARTIKCIEVIANLLGVRLSLNMPHDSPTKQSQ